MGPLQFVVSTHQFWNGAVAGLVAAGLVVVGATISPARRLPVAGIAFALAAYVGLDRSGAVALVHRVPVTLIAGLAIACVLPEIAARVGSHPLLIGVAAVPGAMVTAGALIGVADWVRVAVVGFGAIGGACVADFDRAHARRGAAPLLWLITVGAVYSTVPDTEAARVLLGAAIPIAGLGWPRMYARLGVGGACASVCVLGWTIGQNGAGRAGSIVGAMGALGVFVLAPVLRGAGARARDRRSWSTPAELALTTLAHAAIALTAARWAGLAHDASTATLRLLVMLPFALVLTWAVAEEPARPVRRGAAR